MQKMKEGPIPKKGPLVLVLFSSQFSEKKDQEKKILEKILGINWGKKENIKKIIRLQFLKESGMFQ